ncbi:MAG TPA: alpha/beta fold hydrolase [Gemmatimonadales bacterium]
MNLQIRAARLAMRALQHGSPTLAAALAERLFFTPPRTRLGPQVAAFLRTGRPLRVRVREGRIAAWSWGEGGGPVVVLAHGWGGRGARLAAAYVEPLVAQGFSVVTFDAPGHGASDGWLSSMPQFARALQAVADAAGSVFAIAAHSMGGSASALAMSQGLQVDRAVFLAPAADPARFAADFASTLAVGPVAMAAMRDRSERRLAFRWADLDVPRMARAFDVPLLVIHDRDDATVPWTDGAAIAAAWPGAELVTTTGLGHRDVVRDSGVVDRVVAFIREGREQAVADEGGWLERDLFRREGRRRRIFAD